MFYCILSCNLSQSEKFLHCSNEDTCVLIFILDIYCFRDCGLFEIWPSEVVQQICKHSKVEEVGGSLICILRSLVTNLVDLTSQYGYNKVIEKDTSASEFVYIVTAVSHVAST